MNEDMFVGTLVFLGLMITVGTIGRIILRVIDARMRRYQPTLPSGIEARIERIEQIVEATSIEVERISEGQRFTTKLLAEKTVPALPQSDRGSS